MVSKVNGIVIKESDMGESGKRIVVLTKEHGKMLLSIFVLLFAARLL